MKNIFKIALFLPIIVPGVCFGDYTVASSSNVLNTEYHNTGSTALIEQVTVANVSNLTDDASSTVYSVAGSNSPIFQRCNTGAANRFCSITVIVPATYYYRINAPTTDTLNSWQEFTEISSGGGGGGMSTTTTVYQLVGNLSSTTPDGSEQAIFHGILLFFLTFFGLVFMLKRNY